MVKPLTHNKKILKALELMENFAGSTGLLGEKGNPHRRYLWTDAFAVQTFFRLNHKTGEEKFRHLALKLIDEVHGNLGKYREDDDRSGWEDHQDINAVRLSASLAYS